PAVAVPKYLAPQCRGRRHDRRALQILDAGSGQGNAAAALVHYPQRPRLDRIGLPQPGRNRELTLPRLHHRRSLPLRSRGRSGEPFLLLPGEYAVGHTFEKVGRTDDGLYAPEPQPLSAHVDFYGLARV